jgi:hypothetical protein
MTSLSRFVSALALLACVLSACEEEEGSDSESGWLAQVEAYPGQFVAVDLPVASPAFSYVGMLEDLEVLFTHQGGARYEFAVPSLPPGEYAVAVEGYTVKLLVKEKIADILLRDLIFAQQIRIEALRARLRVYGVSQSAEDAIDEMLKERNEISNALMELLPDQTAAIRNKLSAVETGAVASALNPSHAALTAAECDVPFYENIRHRCKARTLAQTMRPVAQAVGHYDALRHDKLTRIADVVSLKALFVGLNPREPGVEEQYAALILLPYAKVGELLFSAHLPSLLAARAVYDFSLVDSEPFTFNPLSATAVHVVARLDSLDRAHAALNPEYQDFVESYDLLADKLDLPPFRDEQAEVLSTLNIRGEIVSGAPVTITYQDNYTDRSLRLQLSSSAEGGFELQLTVTKDLFALAKVVKGYFTQTRKCGLSGSVAERVESCNHEESSFELVADNGVNQVWRYQLTGWLWTDPLEQKMAHTDAVSACQGDLQEALGLDLAWQLPAQGNVLPKQSRFLGRFEDQLFWLASPGSAYLWTADWRSGSGYRPTTDLLGVRCTAPAD